MLLLLLLIAGWKDEELVEAEALVKEGLGLLELLASPRLLDNQETSE